MGLSAPRFAAPVSPECPTDYLARVVLLAPDSELPEGETGVRLDFAAAVAIDPTPCRGSRFRSRFRFRLEIWIGPCYHGLSRRVLSPGRPTGPT